MTITMVEEKPMTKPSPSATVSSSTLTNDNTDAAAKPKRNRTSKPKVKTGCSNCKKRRIKCDELRPQCTQCQKSKKNCPGYPPPSRSLRMNEIMPIAPKPMLQPTPIQPVRQPVGPRRRREQKLMVRKLSQKEEQDAPVKTSPTVGPLYRPPISTLPLQDQEGLYFQLFRVHTARELSGFFDSLFWTRTVLQSCHSETTIRHAVVALGALYKTMEEAHDSPPNSRAGSPLPNSKANDHWQVAVNQYSEAIKSAVVLKGQSEQSHRTLLMASVLLACFDSFVGDFKQGITQIQNGLKLLEKVRVTAKDSYFPVEDELTQMFTRLAIQAKSYDMAFHFPKPYVVRLNLELPEIPSSPHSEVSTPSSASTQHPSLPQEFMNLADARVAWDKLAERMLRFNETLFDFHNQNGPMGILPRYLKRYGMGFKSQIESWSDAFEPILASRWGPNVSFQEKAAIAVLKMFQIMGQVLFLMTFSDNESGFDMFEPQFQTIVKLALELVGDEERRAAVQRCPDPSRCPHRSRMPEFFGGHEYSAYHVKPSFSADMGIIPPLYVVATKCRNYMIRRQAIQLLRSSSRREGMWDSQLCARIGVWVASIEEEEDPAPVSDASTKPRNSSIDFGENIPLGPGGNARWDLRRSSIPGLPGRPTKRSVPEEKRVMVQAVDFDLQARFAKLSVGTRGIQPNAPDLRFRETQISW